MKKRSSITLGPGAPSLILIFVVLGMSALGMLALMSARNDLHLSERSAEVAEIVYQLNEQAEETRRDVEKLLAGCAAEAESEEAWFAEIGDRLPAGITLEGDLLRWTEETDVRSLECAIRLRLEDGVPHTEWAGHRLVTELGEGMDDLWS